MHVAGNLKRVLEQARSNFPSPQLRFDGDVAHVRRPLNRSVALDGDVPDHLTVQSSHVHERSELGEPFEALFQRLAAVDPGIRVRTQRSHRVHLIVGRCSKLDARPQILGQAREVDGRNGCGGFLDLSDLLDAHHHPPETSSV
jgi:hypothetical protein